MVKDYKSNRFNNVNEMCCSYGIEEKLYKKRKAKGWTQKQALLFPAECGTEFIDHMGNVFPSDIEMCKHWNTTTAKLARCLEQKMSLQEALEGHRTETASEPVNNEKLDQIRNKIKDVQHLVEMPDEDIDIVLDELLYSLHDAVRMVEDARTRIRQRATNRRVSKMTEFKKLVDHGYIKEREIAALAAETFHTSVRYGRYWKRLFCDGNEELISMVNDRMITLKHANKLLSMDKETYDHMINLLCSGYTFREAMLACSKIIDHKGNTYVTVNEMCRAWNISKKLYEARRLDGWPLVYALTKAHNDVFTDHFGNEFFSLASLCNHYSIDKFQFCERMDDGWDLKDALTLPTTD